MSALQKGHSFEETVSVKDRSLSGSYAVLIYQELSTFRITQCLHIQDQEV